MSVLIHSCILVLLAPAPGRMSPRPQQEKLYTVSEVDIKPQPSMGLREFQDIWSRKVAYPKDALAKNIHGMVYIEFVIDKDGGVYDATVKQGIGYGCDAAALKAFKEVTKERWKAGILNEQPVKVKMVLPFFFRIIKK